MPDGEDHRRQPVNLAKVIKATFWVIAFWVPVALLSGTGWEFTLGPEPGSNIPNTAPVAVWVAIIATGASLAVVRWAWPRK